MLLPDACRRCCEAQRDLRFDRLRIRLAEDFEVLAGAVEASALLVAGILHIVIFAGFLALSVRSSLPGDLGDLSDDLCRFPGEVGHLYRSVTDWPASLVFVCVIVAAVRRVIFKPARYAVPERYGKDHPPKPFVLGLIAMLMVWISSLLPATLRRSPRRASS